MKRHVLLASIALLLLIAAAPLAAAETKTVTTVVQQIIFTEEPIRVITELGDFYVYSKDEHAAEIIQALGKSLNDKVRVTLTYGDHPQNPSGLTDAKTLP